MYYTAVTVVLFAVLLDRVLDRHYWQHFHHISVLEESQKTQANFLSSYKLSGC